MNILIIISLIFEYINCLYNKPSLVDQDTDLELYEQRLFRPYEKLPLEFPYSTIIIESRNIEIIDDSIDLSQGSPLIKELDKIRSNKNTYVPGTEFIDLVNKRKEELGNKKYSELRDDSSLKQLVKFKDDAIAFSKRNLKEGEKPKINFGSDDLTKIISKWRENMKVNSLKKDSFLDILIQYANYWIDNECWYEACKVMQYYDHFAISSVGQAGLNIQNEIFYNAKNEFLQRLSQKMKEKGLFLASIATQKNIQTPKNKIGSGQLTNFPNIFTVPFADCEISNGSHSKFFIHLNVKFRYFLMMKLLAWNKWRLEDADKSAKIDPFPLPIFTIKTRGLAEKFSLKDNFSDPLIWEDLLFKSGSGYDIRPMCLQAIDVLYFNAIAGFINSDFTNELLNAHCEKENFEMEQLEIRTLLQVMLCENNPNNECFSKTLEEIKKVIGEKKTSMTMKFYAILARLINSKKKSILQNHSKPVEIIKKFQWKSIKETLLTFIDSTHPLQGIISVIAKIFITNNDFIEALWIHDLYYHVKVPKTYGDIQRELNLVNDQIMQLANEIIDKDSSPIPVFPTDKIIQNFIVSIIKEKKALTFKDGFNISTLFPSNLSTKGFQPDKDYHERMEKLAKLEGISSYFLRFFMIDIKFTQSEIVNPLPFTPSNILPIGKKHLDPTMKKAIDSTTPKELDANKMSKLKGDIEEGKNTNYLPVEDHPDYEKYSELLASSLQFSIDDIFMGVKGDSPLGKILNSALLAAIDGRIYHTLALLYEFDQFFYSPLKEGLNEMNNNLLSEEAGIMEILKDRLVSRFPDLIKPKFPMNLRKTGISLIDDYKPPITSTLNNSKDKSNPKSKTRENQAKPIVFSSIPNLGLIPVLLNLGFLSDFLNYEREKLDLLDKMMTLNMPLILDSNDHVKKIEKEKEKEKRNYFIYSKWMMEKDLGFDPRPQCLQACEISMLNARAGLYDKMIAISNEIDKYCKGNEFFSWKIAEANAYIALKKYQKERKDTNLKKKAQEAILDCSKQFRNIICYGMLVQFDEIIKLEETKKQVQSTLEKEFQKKELSQIGLVKDLLKDFDHLGPPNDFDKSGSLNKFWKIDNDLKIKFYLALYGSRTSDSHSKRRLYSIQMFKAIFDAYEKIFKKFNPSGTVQKPKFQRLIDPKNICNIDTWDYIPPTRIEEMEANKKLGVITLPIIVGSISLLNENKKNNDPLSIVQHLKSELSIIKDWNTLSTFYIENIQTIKEISKYDVIVEKGNGVSDDILECKSNSIIQSILNGSIKESDIKMIGEIKSRLKSILLKGVVREICKIKLNYKEVISLKLEEKKMKIKNLHDLLNVYLVLLH